MRFLAAQSSILFFLLAPKTVESQQSDEKTCKETYCTRDVYGSNEASCEQMCAGCNDQCNCINNPQCADACDACARNCGAFAKGSLDQQTCLNQCQECVRDCNGVSLANLGACNDKCSVRCPAVCAAAADPGTCMTICTEAVEKCGGDPTCMDTVDACTTNCGGYPPANQTICQAYCSNNCAVQTCHVTDDANQGNCFGECVSCVTGKCKDEGGCYGCVERCTQTVANTYKKAPPPAAAQQLDATTLQQCNNQCNQCNMQNPNAPPCACTNNATCCSDACSSCDSGCSSLSNSSVQASCKKNCFQCVSMCGNNASCYKGCSYCLNPTNCLSFDSKNQLSCVIKCENSVGACKGNTNCIYDQFGCAYTCGGIYYAPGQTNHNPDVQLICLSLCINKVLQCEGDFNCINNSIECFLFCGYANLFNGRSFNDQKACLNNCNPSCGNKGRAASVLQRKIRK